MNFSLETKNELAAISLPKSPCCRRAYLHGLFLDMAETRGGKLVLTLSSATARNEAMRSYREYYHREALMDKSKVLFSSSELYAELTGERDIFKCKHCGGSFFRGLMLAYGSVTDPQKSYRLEIRLRDPDNLPFLEEFFAKHGWQGSVRTAGEGACVTFRRHEIISDMLAFAGANQAAFHYMNVKIAKEIRNTENRATNCVTRNIRNSVGASGKCCEAIAILRRFRKLETLPAELRETARLREENPDASLSELAFMHNPTITKSGLNHRLQRIIQLAAEIGTGDKS